MNSETALLLIDVQLNMFDLKNPVFNAPVFLARFKKLLSLSRASGTRIVFVQNNGGAGEPDEPRTEGWLLHPELEIEVGDLIIQKNECDAFEGTSLENKLKQTGVTKLIVAGLQSEYCVLTNAKKAVALGFEVTLVADAHSTYDSGGQKAKQIIERVNGELESLVRLWHVDDVTV
jgi:nicotinamidase-related amidase